MNDNVNDPELSAPQEIISFRAEAARGNYLRMDRPDFAVQRKGDIGSNIETNKQGSAQNRESGEVLG